MTSEKYLLSTDDLESQVAVELTGRELPNQDVTIVFGAAGIVGVQVCNAQLLAFNACTFINV